MTSLPAVQGDVKPVRERPVTMQERDVLALLIGLKTQHRVPMRGGYATARNASYWRRVNRSGNTVWHERFGEKSSISDKPRYGVLENIRCPFGDIGTRLWVREPFKIVDWMNFPAIVAAADDEHLSGDYKRILPIFREQFYKDRYAANRLPRWASRISVEVTGLRVHRISDINEWEVRREGFRRATHGPNIMAAYRAYWDLIHGDGAFDKSLWVWAITFNVLPPSKERAE